MVRSCLPEGRWLCRKKGPAPDSWKTEEREAKKKLDGLHQGTYDRYRSTEGRHCKQTHGGGQSTPATPPSGYYAWGRRTTKYFNVELSLNKICYFILWALTRTGFQKYTAETLRWILAWLRWSDPNYPCKFWTERDTASISYNEAEGLETEFAHSVDAEEWDTPDGIRMNLNLATDNNDANIETLDGKQTLHATAGYTCQHVLSEKIRSALKTLWSLERGETRESLWETSEKFLSWENLLTGRNLSVVEKRN